MEGEAETGTQTSQEGEDLRDSNISTSSHIKEPRKKHYEERTRQPATSQYLGEESDDDAAPQPQPDTRESRGSSHHTNTNQPSRTFPVGMEPYVLGLVVLAFAIGVPVGYFGRRDCGQCRFDQIDTDLQHFLTGPLKHSIEKTLGDISSETNSFYKNQKKNLDNIQSSLRESNTNIKESASEISQSTEDLKQAWEKLNTKLVTAEKYMNEMKSKLTTIAGNIENSQGQLGQSATTFKTESEAAVANIKELSGATTQEIAKIATDTITSMESESLKYNSDLQKSASSVQDIIKKVDGEMQELGTSVGKVSQQQLELTQVVSTTTSTGAALDKARTELEGQVGNLKKWEDKFCANGNTEAKHDYVGWGLHVVQIVVIMMLYMAVTGSRRDNPVRSTVPQGAVAARQPQRVSAGLGVGPGPRRPPPTGAAQYEVTVVTFTQETYDQSRRVFTETVGQAWPPPGKVEYKMLTGELDLSQIPSSRGYIVVIGYDARNSILEDMDGSMGSRKRQTVVGLQKTKRDVLVIYIDSDHQIEEPPENTLYNTHLDRPTSHPILSPLVDVQRFLSLRHWRPTRLQTAHIDKWLRALR